MNFSDRLASLTSSFADLFEREPDFLVRSPGRAELIGNHTDYNGGFALGCAISPCVLIAGRAKTDRTVTAHSTAYPKIPAIIDLPKLAHSVERSDESAYRMGNWGEQFFKIWYLHKTP